MWPQHQQAHPHPTQQARQHLLARSLHQQGGEPFKAVHQLFAARHVPEVRLRAQRKESINVAIIGGGMAGLYAAYLFEKHFPDKIHYTILEKDERVGGRVHTHHFSDAAFQYGEFGAMRIPELHEPVLDLIDELKVERIPFIFSNDDSLYFVNGAKTDDGKIMTKKYAEEHPEKLGFMKIHVFSEDIRLLAVAQDFDGITLNLKRGVDPATYKTVVSIYNKVYDELAKALEEDIKQGKLDDFLDKYDKYTVYSYFHETVPVWLKRDCSKDPPKAKVDSLVDSVLHYAEMTSSATGLNHLALVESVLDNRNFDGKQWYTVKNGMNNFPEALASKLKKSNIHLGAKVIALETPDGDKTGQDVNVTWEDKNGKRETKTFDCTLVTAPFGSVRFMNISVPFTYGKKQAIRSLNYDHSTKIFAQFPKRWWEQEKKLVGGASLTDLPIRTVVYPSYGENDPGKGVLLTSYTWQNDAILWANADKRTLKETVLHNLATLHSTTPFNHNDVDLAVHTWLEAFALFGPGQFKLMINAMIPEYGVHFAGEHLSTYHAWILGALNSATRAVREILVLEGLLTVEESWQKFPDTEFDEATWKEYMEQVKPPQSK